MQNTIKPHLRRLLYRLRHDFLTLNNIVITVAVFIALNWIWNSVSVMQQNYELQQLVDSKKYQVALETLHVETLELESKYYETLEYQELAVRERLGKGLPGERVVIVPSTDTATDDTSTPRSTPPPASNFQEWVNFLFGTKR